MGDELMTIKLLNFYRADQRLGPIDASESRVT